MLRGALVQLRDVGYDAVAAIEYEVRLRDRDDRPVTSGISYSAGEVAAIDPFVSALRPALEDLGVDLTAVHTEAAPGLIELNLAARPEMRKRLEGAGLDMLVLNSRQMTELIRSDAEKYARVARQAGIKAE